MAALIFKPFRHSKVTHKHVWGVGRRGIEGRSLSACQSIARPHHCNTTALPNIHTARFKTQPLQYNIHTPANLKHSFTLQ